MLADFHLKVILWLLIEDAKGAVGRFVFSEEKTSFHSPCILSIKAKEHMPASSGALSIILLQWLPKQSMVHLSQEALSPTGVQRCVQLCPVF